MTNLRFGGIICPMLTPFDENGELDLPATRQLVDFLISQGVDGLLPAGTTGEGMLLSTQERKRLAEVVVEQAAGRAAVMVHTGSITTTETVELTRHAQGIGADGASVITPYFYSYNDQALFEHYLAVAGAVPNFPLSLYAYPGNAKNEISLDLFRRLRQAAPNIIAIKLSSIDLIRFQEYVQAGGEEFSPLCGVDALALPALCIGAAGQVSGNANVFPDVFHKLYQAYATGDLLDAQRQQVLINKIREVFRDNLAYFKAAMPLRGIPVGQPRRPIQPLNPQEVDLMKAKLHELDLL